MAKLSISNFQKYFQNLNELFIKHTGHREVIEFLIKSGVNIKNTTYTYSDQEKNLTLLHLASVGKFTKPN